jgi:hypothetical protein
LGLTFIFVDSRLLLPLLRELYLRHSLAEIKRTIPNSLSSLAYKLIKYGLVARKRPMTIMEDINLISTIFRELVGLLMLFSISIISRHWRLALLLVHLVAACCSFEIVLVRAPMAFIRISISAHFK